MDADAEYNMFMCEFPYLYGLAVELKRPLLVNPDMHKLIDAHGGWLLVPVLEDLRVMGDMVNERNQKWKAAYRIDPGARRELNVCSLTYFECTSLTDRR